jgi:hypothetical protein
MLKGFFFYNLSLLRSMSIPTSLGISLIRGLLCSTFMQNIKNEKNITIAFTYCMPYLQRT